MEVPLSDDHIHKMAEEIVSWEPLCQSFSLSEADMEEIRRDLPDQYFLQKRKMLWKWKIKLGKKATYNELWKRFVIAGNQHLADRVEELYSQSFLDEYKQHLKDCYTPTSQPPSHIHEWPPLCNAKFVQPRFTLKPMNNVKGEQEKEVSLTDIISACKQGKKPVKILLVGVAGSGKTTISWHACQQWAEGNMFQEFEFLIYLSLADPHIQSASSFKDLIGHPCNEVCNVVAKAIEGPKKKKVCFVMDGWENLPTTLQESTFLRSLIQGNASEVVIVTSRPIAAGSIVFSMFFTYNIREFSDDDIAFCAYQYLPTKVEQEKFISSLKAMPSVYSLCSLPINLLNMVTHFHTNHHHSLPSTQTVVYESLLLALLLRHLRKIPEYQSQTKLLSISELPDPLIPVFSDLCQLAHFLTFKSQNQSTCDISSTELQEANIPIPKDTLGLMKVSEEVTCRGCILHYSFLQLTVQDFLCAVWMMNLDKCEQESNTRVLLTNNDTSLVCEFFDELVQPGGKHQKTLKLKQHIEEERQVEKLQQQLIDSSADKQQTVKEMLASEDTNKIKLMELETRVQNLEMASREKDIRIARYEAALFELKLQLIGVVGIMLACFACVFLIFP